MKIAIIYDMLYPFNVGGAEIRNYQMAKQLSLRHEVHLFGVKMWIGPDVIKREGIIYHGVCRYSKMYNFDGARTIWEPIKFALKLFFPLLREKFDIIDTSSFVYFHCFVCKAVSILNKTPLILTWHQYWSDYWYDYIGGLQAFVGKLIEKTVKNLTQNHIAVSLTTRKDLINAGVPPKNIFVVYNGVNLNIVKKTPISQEKFDVLFVGRLIHQKNIGLLIKTADLIRKDFPNLKVGIIGNGPNYEQLKKMSVKLGLEKNIIFLGFLSNLKDVYAYMKAAKIFVLPSLLEGFGIVVIEANANGLPVIVVKNKWNAAVELVTNGKNGFIVDNNIDDLAKKISYLLKNDNIRFSMKNEAQKFAANFDWQNLAEKLEIIYTNIKNEQ
ncbi:MAG: glycosyltransferase family 4 protein [Candidatus Paceibacterota bacterium]|jgi:glycosyltransferase involved in cell wall biosynthesis